MHAVMVRLLVSAFLFSLGASPVAFAAEGLPSGFVAISESPMPWAEAKSFCERNNGKLPLIDGKDALEWGKRRTIRQIDGFGAVDDKWPALPNRKDYWLGVKAPDYEGSWWFINGKGGSVTVKTSPALGSVGYKPDVAKQVVCVPK